MAKTKKTTEESKTEEKLDKSVDKSEKADKSNKKDKLAKLMAKAKQLEGKVEDVKAIDVKKEVKALGSEKENALVPMEDYFKSSIHLGTRVITPDMKNYVYKRRADGLAVFNMPLVDDKIKEAAEYLAEFAPENVLVVCKREAGWKAVKLFVETVGMKSFTKKYPAGILTNTTLDNFMEANLILICDPWLDKNALMDANRVRIPVLAIGDTNNYTAGITKVLPGNNKAAKSLGMIFYILTKIYVEKRKMDVKVPSIQEFVDDWDQLQPPK